MWIRKDQALIILIGDFCHFRFERLLRLQQCLYQFRSLFFGVGGAGKWRNADFWYLLSNNWARLLPETPASVYRLNLLPSMTGNFLLLKKSGFPHKWSSFLEQKNDFLWVWWSALICFLLLGLSFSLSLQFLFSFISQKAFWNPPAAPVNLFYLLCVVRDCSDLG